MPGRSEMGQGQDWNEVSFSNTKPKPKQASTTSSGGGSSRPTSARGGNGVTTSAGFSAQRLEEDTETLKHQTVSTDLKQALMKARNAKGMTQKQLAVAMVIDAKTINEYESGKAIPNNQVIAKMEKVLGVKLPRASKVKS